MSRKMTFVVVRLPEVEPDYRVRDFQFEAPGIRVNVCAGHGRGNIARERGGTRMTAIDIVWGRRDCEWLVWIDPHP